MRFWITLAIALGVSLHASALDESALSRSDRQVELAVKQLEQNDMEAARRHIAKALRAFPHHPGAHMLLGHLAMADEKYEAALDHYEHAQAGYELLIREQLHSHAQEAVLIQDAVNTINPRSNSVYEDYPPGFFDDVQNTKRDFELRSSGRMPLAKNEVERGHAMQVPPVVALFRGRALLALGRNNEAIEAWRSVADELPLAHTHLAAAYVLIGAPVEAGVELAKAEAAGVTVSDELREWVYTQIQDEAKEETP